MLKSLMQSKLVRLVEAANVCFVLPQSLRNFVIELRFSVLITAELQYKCAFRLISGRLSLEFMKLRILNVFTTGSNV
jgi:hypothetical protein